MQQRKLECIVIATAETSPFANQAAFLQEHGYVHLPGFFKQGEVAKISEQILGLIVLLAEHHNIALSSEDRADHMRAYRVVTQQKPELHPVIYDALKNLPAFMAMVSHPQSLELAKALLAPSQLGIAHKSYGMRIDRPNEDGFNAPWHQDFHAHGRSDRGLVFWIPVCDLELEDGPVQILGGSHQEGPQKLMPEKHNHAQSSYTLRSQAMQIVDIEGLCERHPVEQLTTKAGDLVVIDYMTVHRSGFNRGQNSRWTVQIRYFDFANAWGIENGWKGSITAGNEYEDLFPELILKAVT